MILSTAINTLMKQWSHYTTFRFMSLSERFQVDQSTRHIPKSTKRLDCFFSKYNNFKQHKTYFRINKNIRDCVFSKYNNFKFAIAIGRKVLPKNFINHDLRVAEGMIPVPGYRFYKKIKEKMFFNKSCNNVKSCVSVRNSVTQ